MEVTAYLNFDGKCEDAFRFYETLLGGKIEELHTFGQSPMGGQMPPGWQDKVMHVRLTVGKSVLMGSDAPTQHFERPQGFSVSVAAPTKAEGERIFNGLAEGGKVTMPFQSTFWSAGFGSVTDRFGTPWMVNTNQPPQG